MRTKRFALMGASLVLIGGMTAACGGGGAEDAPTDASKDDFCGQMEKLGDSDFDEGKEAVDDIIDLGTPEDIPDDARRGFEVIMDALDEIENEDDEIDESKYSDDDNASAAAFYSWLNEYC